MRCAHIPPPCHFSVCFDLFVSLSCSDLLVCLTAGVLIFVSKVIKFSIIFEARAVIFEARTVILEARGAIWTSSEIFVIFNEKVTSTTPPRCIKIHILRSREVVVFLRFFFVWIFVILSAQTLYSGFNFEYF